ncbi:hypothetical protein FQA39_LY02025 [Lamprigera yunnana]|nr:hypothetical protein FQA39_LY02025 [Lamprigera yunnana]
MRTFKNFSDEKVSLEFTMLYIQQTTARFRHMFKNIKFTHLRYYSANVIRSPFADVVIPNICLPEFVLQSFTKHSNKTALECVETGRKYTFEEVRKKSINLNKGLRKKFNTRKDDVVAIVLPNIPEYAICLLGSLLAHLRVTTVNPLATAVEIRRQLVDSSAETIFTTCSLENHIRAVVSKIPKSILIVAIKTQATDVTPNNFISFNELVDTEVDTEDNISTQYSTDTALIPYSSGTTGFQKGVLHSHHALIASACLINSPETNIFEPATESYQEVVPAILPFFHLFGNSIHIISQLSLNCKLLTMPKFTLAGFVDLLKNHQPRFIYAVPLLVLYLTNSPFITRNDLKSLQYVMCGATRLSEKEEETFYNKVEGATQLIQMYGLTEAHTVTTNLKNNIIRNGSIGKPLQNTEVKVVPVNNVQGESLDLYEEGEILIKGPQIMKGYLNRPKETSDSFVNGWLRTGDLGYYDERNEFHLKDRLKDLIKVKGVQVAPAELEELIQRYNPDITEAVVIGIPHSIYGEVPQAYITLKPNSKINLMDLDKFVTNNVSKHKRMLGGFQIVDCIPKSTTGKYLRKELRNKYIKENM